MTSVPTFDQYADLVERAQNAEAQLTEMKYAREELELKLEIVEAELNFERMNSARLRLAAAEAHQLSGLVIE